jgi:hypothetical protein
VWIIFALYKVDSIQALRRNFNIILKNTSHLFVIAIAGLLIWVPQLIYWKSVTGHFFFFSYGEERFYFNHPHIIQGLLSYRKGWLVYTPIMFFAVAGIIVLYFKMRQFFLPVSLFFILNVYIVFSWWCWWYGGGFGQRPMIDSYPLLAIPLTLVISLLIKQRRLISIPSIATFAFFIYLNIFQHFQYYYGAIHWDSMTKAAYWETFLKLYPTRDYWYMLKPIDNERAVKGEI